MSNKPKIAKKHIQRKKTREQKNKILIIAGIATLVFIALMYFYYMSV